MYKKKTDVIWIKVSHDEYELPLAVADTAEELAKICGISVATIYETRSRHVTKGQWSSYIKVETDVNEVDVLHW